MSSLFNFIPKDSEQTRQLLGHEGTIDDNIDENDDNKLSSLVGGSTSLGNITLEESILEKPEGWIPNELKFTLRQAHGIKPISALAINSKGTRMATGGLDTQVSFWDFMNMQRKREPFRQIPGSEGYPVMALSYSPNGAFICGAFNDPVVKVYNGEGQQVHETFKAYIHVRDTAKTQGHTHAVPTLQWCPIDNYRFASGSQDSTVRIWDITAKTVGIDEALPHAQLFKVTSKTGQSILSGRGGIQAINFFSTGQAIIGACADGSLHIWNVNRRYPKPEKICRSNLSDFTGMALASDDYTLVTRGRDDSLHIWDIRKWSKDSSGEPVHIFSEKLWNASAVGSNVIIKGNKAITGIYPPPKNCSDVGSIKIFDLTKLVCDMTIDLPKEAGGAGPVRYSDSLGQLFVGCGDSSIRMFTGQYSSTRGATLLHSEDDSLIKKSHKDLEDDLQPPAIYILEELPAGVRATRDGGVRLVRGPIARHQDPNVDKKQQPSVIPRGREIRAAGLRTDDDAVAAIRKRAAEAEADPIFTRAYKYTQPTTILDEPESDSGPGLTGSKCPFCGLKLCTCGYLAHQAKKSRVL